MSNGVLISSFTGIVSKTDETGVIVSKTEETGVIVSIFLTISLFCADAEIIVKTKNSRKMPAFILFINIFNLFTSFSKSSFSTLVIYDGFVKIIFIKIWPQYLSKI